MRRSKPCCARAEAHLGHELPLTPDGRAALRAMADGDGRFLLNLVEEIERLPHEQALGPQELAELVQRRAPLYDKKQEGHYNLISALHKSLRGSDTDAALYWLARMLAGGEDPVYILRRLTRAAVEDIGLADPQALVQALAAWDAYDRLGSPEGELALAQLVIYLATAPKSNAAYDAFGEAQRDGARHRLADAADAHPERADPADAQPRLRQRLCLRPRDRGRVFRAELFSGRLRRAANSTARPSAASSARSRSGSITGTSCAQRVADGDDERRHHRHGAARRTAPAGSTAGSSGIIRGSATAGSKSCCAPARSGSTASAPAPATRSRPGKSIRVPPLPEAPAATAEPRQPPRARPQDVALLRDAVLYRDDWALVAQQAGRPRGAGRHRHRAPCRCAARRAALRVRRSGRASCTGSTRTPRACC